MPDGAHTGSAQRAAVRRSRLDRHASPDQPELPLGEVGQKVLNALRAEPPPSEILNHKPQIPTSSPSAPPSMPVRRLHNFIYCKRLFYYQWVENIFVENADTTAGSTVHRKADRPTRLPDADAMELPEGRAIRSLPIEDETLGLVGAIDVVEGGEHGL